jgi:two-component system nitrogen regulation sensor histidine kinase NtrY
MFEILKSKRIHKRASAFLVFLSIFFGFITYYSITHHNVDEGQFGIIFILLIDLVLLLGLTALISKKIMQMRMKNLQATDQAPVLQNKILLLFSGISSIPTIIVAIFSAIFFNYVIDSWFDKRVSTALDESVYVAESYLREHKEVLKIKAKSMALELDNNIIHHNLVNNPDFFYQILESLSDLNSISEAVVYFDYKPVVRTRFASSLSFESIMVRDIKKAMQGEVVILENDPNRIRAIAALRSIPNSYIIVGKLIDTDVVQHIQKTQGAASKFRNLKDKITSLQIRFTLMFLIVAMILVTSAVWFGANFASKITKPIRKLVEATEKIKAGDLNILVPEGKNDDEITSLAKGFNLMIKQISKQQQKLVVAYEEIHSKHKFSQAVLSGVSAGILALNKNLEIVMLNEAAIKLLDVSENSAISKTISELVPEFKNIDFENAGKSIIKEEREIRRGKKQYTLLVRVVGQIVHDYLHGYIVTFDDMTELEKAQRHAAWSDVARRIAHEVKNPLTPIHLSADMLKTKFANQVSDKANFEKYTNTIIRHTSDIAKIIGEFTNFARMPKPSPTEVKIYDVAKEVVFSRKCVATKIKFDLVCNDKDLKLFADQTQVNQLLINILKNAEESIQSTERYDNNDGLIEVKLEKANKYVKITVTDNGKGFDQATINKLTEPYFTTRTKGTGLGLAIVKKIIEDHSGKLELSGDEFGRAVVEILLPEA